MEEDDPVAFGHLVDWLYTKKLRCHLCNHDSYKETMGHTVQWIKLWLPADNLGIENLAVETTMAYKRCTEIELWVAADDSWGMPMDVPPRLRSKCQLGFEEVVLLYEEASPSCPIRELQLHRMLRHKYELEHPDIDSFDEDHWTLLLSSHEQFRSDMTKADRGHAFLHRDKCGIQRCYGHNRRSAGLDKLDEQNLQW